MKIKLDLHPIYNDTHRIEEALQQAIDDAVTRRASEVEIIPGKGSGALKKTVLRFLDRPEVKARYHRIEKDGDNWGRLFVHFRHVREGQTAMVKPETPSLSVPCICCGVAMDFPLPETDEASVHLECPSCGSPHKVAMRWDRKGRAWPTAELNYPG